MCLRTDDGILYSTTKQVCKNFTACWSLFGTHLSPILTWSMITESNSRVFSPIVEWLCNMECLTLTLSFNDTYWPTRLSKVTCLHNILTMKWLSGWGLLCHALWWVVAVLKWGHVGTWWRHNVASVDENTQQHLQWGWYQSYSFVHFFIRLCCIDSNTQWIWRSYVGVARDHVIFHPSVATWWHGQS